MVHVIQVQTLLLKLSLRVSCLNSQVNSFLSTLIPKTVILNSMLTILIHNPNSLSVIIPTNFWPVSSEVPSTCSNHTALSFIQSSSDHFSKSASMWHSPAHVSPHVPCSPTNPANSSSSITMSHSSHVSPSPHVSYSSLVSDNQINSPIMPTSNIPENTSSTCPIPPILALHRPCPKSTYDYKVQNWYFQAKFFYYFHLPRTWFSGGSIIGL